MTQQLFLSFLSFGCPLRRRKFVPEGRERSRSNRPGSRMLFQAMGSWTQALRMHPPFKLLASTLNSCPLDIPRRPGRFRSRKARVFGRFLVRCGGRIVSGPNDVNAFHDVIEPCCSIIPLVVILNCGRRRRLAKDAIRHHPHDPLPRWQGHEGEVNEAAVTGPLPGQRANNASMRSSAGGSASRGGTLPPAKRLES